MSEDDPFEEFEAPEDREGDPFERLDDAGAGDDAEPAPSAEESDDDADGEGSPDDEAPAFEEEFIEAPALDGVPENESAADDDPFAGMDDRAGDPFGSGESAFEAVDVDELDAEEVWATLDEDADSTSESFKRYTEVSKHRFCEQCEFFAEPPASHCTHEEAEILEHLDMETVRLVNCPVVAEQRALENEE